MSKDEELAEAVLDSLMLFEEVVTGYAHILCPKTTQRLQGSIERVYDLIMEVEENAK